MSIAKNTIYYTAALLYQKILGFIYFTLIARFLGVDESGRYFFALSFTALFAIFADLGLVPVLIREIAKDKERKNELFSKVLTLKLILAFLSVSLIVLFVNILDYPSYVKNLVYVASLTVLFDSFSLIFWGLFRGFHNLKYESIGVIVFQTLTVGLGTYALFQGYKANTIIYILVLSNFVYFILALSLAWKKLNLRVSLQKLDRKLFSMFRISIPFALAGVFSRIYTQIDTVMISKIGCTLDECTRNVGWYAIATKTTLAMQFIPLALTASLYPTFSKLYRDKEKTRIIDIYTSSYRYLLILSGFIVAIIVSLSTPLVEIIWGDEFLPSSLPMKILMISVVFIFLTFPNGAFLNAAGYQKINTYYMGLSVVINVVLNIFLIYQFSLLGAAIASLISTFSLFMMGFVKVYRLICFPVKMILNHMIKISITIAVTAILAYSAADYMHIVLVLIVSGIIYSILLLGLKEVRLSDIRKIIALIRGI